MDEGTVTEPERPPEPIVCPHCGGPLRKFNVPCGPYWNVLPWFQCIACKHPLT